KNNIVKYETDCISIFKPLFITSLTNALLFIFTSISQILSKVKQTAN
ncbi:hypothetical protein HMPREF9086_4242, partial [Enterobacter hormaechei ATCC 49162]